MEQKTAGKLVLETGQQFKGIRFGSGGNRVGEIIFNTTMVGYQEIISDPAYAGQIVVMTYPLMGQYGITDEDFEGRNSYIEGLIVRECCEDPSNFRYTKTLSEELEEHNVPCLAGLDTRMLTRIIREKGSMKAAIVDAGMSVEDALSLIRQTPVHTDYVSKVSCKKRWFSRTACHKYDVVVIDCGIKASQIHELNKRDCNVTIVPWNTTAEDILSFNPDGVLVSGGPGTPDGVPETVQTIRELKGKLPMMGIALGHQIIACAYDAKIARLKSPHHGDRPVRETETGRIFIADHNNCPAVELSSLEGTPLKVTHTDVVDGAIEGIECAADKMLAVEFYPEGAPGPMEGAYLFDKFVKLMEEK